MAPKSAVHVGIKPLQRLQDADRRGEGRFANPKTGALTPEAPGRDNAHGEISRASQGQQRAEHGNSGERRMHGELFRLAEEEWPRRDLRIAITSALFFGVPNEHRFCARWGDCARGICVSVEKARSRSLASLVMTIFTTCQSIDCASRKNPLPTKIQPMHRLARTSGEAGCKCYTRIDGIAYNTAT